MKIAFIIQARLKSTRLPRKVLLPLPYPNGKPLILWIVDELKKSKFDHVVTIATSDDSSNDDIFYLCERENISCIRGSENDVLSRFTKILANDQYDCVVRLTADNPLIDIDLLDYTIEKHIENDADYTKTKDLPIGMNFEIVKPTALLQLASYSISDVEREHVTLGFSRFDGFKKIILDFPQFAHFSDLRTTVDYASDYALMSLLASVSINEKISGIQLIEKIRDEENWFFEINKNNYQNKPS